MKPIDAIKETLVKQGFSQPIKEYEGKLLDVDTKVRYLYEPGELEGQQYGGERRKRSTDLIWSVVVYKIKDTVFPRINARGVYFKIRDFRGAFISKFQK